MEIYFDKLTRPERVICLVLDDSVIARERRSGYNGKSQLINWFVSKPSFIQALCPDFGWEV